MLRTPHRFAAVAVAIAACLTCAEHAAAGEPEVWSFDLATEGADVFWTSPTAAPTDAPRYEVAYTLDLIEVTVMLSVFEFTVDVTGDVPPEFLAGSEIADGPPPISLIQAPLVFPLPPEPPGLAATVDLLVDADGFGQLSITEVFLGEVDVDLGPPLGIQTVQLLGIRVAGSMSVEPIGPAGDVTGDEVVDFSDLLALLAGWGACPAPPAECPSDTNGDGVTDFVDLLRVLADWT